MTVKLITKDITAHNTFTDSATLVGYFNISLSGTWAATVTTQRSFDGGSTWRDVNTWTANTEEYGLEPERDVLYRVGVKTGDFTNGTVEIRIGQ